MLIDVTYFAQASSVLGVTHERLEASDLRGLLQAVHQHHGAAVEPILCSAAGDPVGWLLVDVSGQLVRDPDHRFETGDTVTFISPISGG